MSDKVEQINEFLQAFAQNPAEIMQRHPTKLNAQDEPVQGATVFAKDAIENKDYIQARDNVRQKIYRMEEISADRAAYEANDKPENLVDRFTHSSLDTMESARLTSANLAESPWSDDYWGIYKGILGARYADPNFPAVADWRVNFDYIRTHHPRDIFNSGNTAAINLLSPSEKYDALVGDVNGTLTRRMWSDGKYYYDANGEVETWMGICHGWSPAAYMLARPQHSVSVVAANGATPITFYPSDIKALASLLWANSPTETRFIGGRCTDKDPAVDPATGRIKSSNCFDTNPGTWHLSIVNQIGASRRGMVMDVTYDYEVWNQPVHGYEYRYFNPQNMNYAASLAAATVPLASFHGDKFHQYRSSRAISVVGIAMRVSYIVETTPSHTTANDPSQDSIQKVDYYYDLELDAHGRIIGGEWYTNEHPDFLWTPPDGARAATRYDYMATGSWQGNRAVPQSWQIAAQQSSKADGAPLAAIVERLIQFARS